MTLIIEKFLCCDGEGYDGGGCGKTNGIDTRSYTAEMQREQAKAEGWVYRNGKDYCEECKKLLTNSQRRG